MNLRNPKYGNSFTLNTGVLVHQLLDADTQIFKPVDRPDIEGFSVSFEALSDDTKDDLIKFFVASAGEFITIQDHEGTNWQGMIMDEEIVFSEAGKTCMWETSFRFEGNRV